LAPRDVAVGFNAGATRLAHCAPPSPPRRFLASNLPSAGDLSTRTLASLGLAGRALAGGGRHGGIERHSGLARASLGLGRGAFAAGGSESGGSTSSRESSPAPGGGRAVGWRLVTVPDTSTALDAFRWVRVVG
jgi:hypothetical protein